MDSVDGPHCLLTTELSVISTKTVEFHKSRLMARLELRTTAELTKYAIAHGIVST